MVEPTRLQRKRTKGFKLESPNGLPVVYVGRGSKWGNPFYVGHPNVTRGTYYTCDNNKEAKEKYATHIHDCYNDEDFKELRGKNLACWCALNEECHADILLELANND